MYTFERRFWLVALVYGFINTNTLAFPQLPAGLSASECFNYPFCDRNPDPFLRAHAAAEALVKQQQRTLSDPHALGIAAHAAAEAKVIATQKEFAQAYPNLKTIDESKVPKLKQIAIAHQAQPITPFSQHTLPHGNHQHQVVFNQIPVFPQPQQIPSAIAALPPTHNNRISVSELQQLISSGATYVPQIAPVSHLTDVTVPEDSAVDTENYESSAEKHAKAEAAVAMLQSQLIGIQQQHQIKFGGTPFATAAQKNEFVNIAKPFDNGNVGPSGVVGPSGLVGPSGSIAF